MEAKTTAPDNDNLTKETIMTDAPIIGSYVMSRDNQVMVGENIVNENESQRDIFRPWNLAKRHARCKSNQPQYMEIEIGRNMGSRSHFTIV